jgi:uncharacterized membrane protein YccC
MFDVPTATGTHTHRTSGEGRILGDGLARSGDCLAVRAPPPRKRREGGEMRRVNYERLVYAVRVALTVAMAVLVVAGAISAG